MSAQPRRPGRRVTGCRALPYGRRRPGQTALYQVVQQHLERYPTLAGEDDWDGPAWGDAPEPMPDWDLLGQPAPDVAFDQRIAW